MSMLAELWLRVVGYCARWRWNFSARRQRLYLHDKMFGQGPSALSDAELLAVLLTGRNSSDTEAHNNAQRLLQHFGDLRSIFSASTKTLINCPGLNKQYVARLRAMPELISRQLLEDMRQGPVLSTHSTIRRYVRLRLRDYKREIFMCIFLDARNRVLATEELFVGSLSGAHVYSREVLLACLRHHAVSVILVHNHPSGKPEPSSSDERVTRRLKTALRLVDISVVDHLVVGESAVVSFHERGLI